MRSATSSEGSQLVVLPCARTRTVAIEMHSRVNGMKRHVFREACLADHQASSIIAW